MPKITNSITRKINICAPFIFLALLSGNAVADDTPQATPAKPQQAIPAKPQQATPAKPQQAIPAKPAAPQPAKPQTTPQAVASDIPQAMSMVMVSDAEQAANFNRQGVQFGSQGDYVRAAEELRNAVELDPLNPEYIYHLALSLSYQKDTMDESIVVQLKAIAMKPSVPKFLALNYYNLACTYALQGKADEAFEALEKLASLDSQDARNQFHVLQGDKDFDSIRNDPRFKQVMEKISRSGKPKDPVTSEDPGKSEEPGK